MELYNYARNAMRLKRPLLELASTPASVFKLGIGIGYKYLTACFRSMNWHHSNAESKLITDKKG